MSEHQLDARRLLCPMPVIRTQDKVAQLEPGDTLVVVCTDHGVKNDLPSWCRINGHEVVSINDTGEEITVTIRVLE